MKKERIVLEVAGGGERWGSAGGGAKARAGGAPRADRTTNLELIKRSNRRVGLRNAEINSVSEISLSNSPIEVDLSDK
jgi:hypothetical protein